jgi:hypothetical protein
MTITTRAVRQERNGTEGWYYPDRNLWLALLAGADDPPEPDPEPEPTPDPDPEPPAPEPEPEPDPEAWDEARARRTIERQRASEKAANERAKAAEARAKELEDAQLSEQEKVVRDRDEARAEADNARRTARSLLIDQAVISELLDQDVDPKRLRRALKLVDRDDITVQDDDVSGADEAVEQFFKDFPEFKKADPDPESDPKKPEPPGGNSDRKRGKGEMTAEQSDKLLKKDPEEWNRRFEAGEIPASALR